MTHLLRRWHPFRNAPCSLSKDLLIDSLIAALVVCPILPIFGYLIFSTMDRLYPDPDQINTSQWIIMGLALYSYASIWLSWAVLLVAVPFSLYLLHIGWAGWAIAIATGALPGIVAIPFTDINVIGIVVPFGAMLGLIYWLILRILQPDTFSLPES